MAYNKAALRMIVSGAVGDSLVGGSIFVYTSADAVATVVAQDYITDPIDQGLAVNDLVIIIDTATPLISIARVKTVSSVSTTGALLSTGVTIGNT